MARVTPMKCCTAFLGGGEHAHLAPWSWCDIGLLNFPPTGRFSFGMATSGSLVYGDSIALGSDPLLYS